MKQACSRSKAANPLSDLESVHLRQVDVEQNQVRLQLLGLLNGHHPVRRLNGL